MHNVNLRNQSACQLYDANQWCKTHEDQIPIVEKVLIVNMWDQDGSERMGQGEG